SRLQELTEDLRVAAGRTDGRDDLGAAGPVGDRAGGHQLCPWARGLRTGPGAVVSRAVTGPVGAPAGGGGRSSSCSIMGMRQTTLARTRPAAAESSARKSWPPPIGVRSKKLRAAGTASASA